MTMSTIYILMKDGEVVDVAPSLSADQALEFFNNANIWSSKTGQIFACHMSDSAAREVREAFYAGPSKGKASAATLAKRYSSTMNHCGDVT